MCLAPTLMEAWSHEQLKQYKDHSHPRQDQGQHQYRRGDPQEHLSPFKNSVCDDQPTQQPSLCQSKSEGAPPTTPLCDAFNSSSCTLNQRAYSAAVTRQEAANIQTRARAVSLACDVFNRFPIGDLFRRINRCRKWSSSGGASVPPALFEHGCSSSRDRRACEPPDSAKPWVTLGSCTSGLQAPSLLIPTPVRNGLRSAISATLSRVLENEPGVLSSSGSSDSSGPSLPASQRPRPEPVPVSATAVSATPTTVGPQTLPVEGHLQRFSASREADLIDRRVSSSGVGQDVEDELPALESADDSSSTGSSNVVKELPAWRVDQVTEDGGIELQFLFDDSSPVASAELDLVRHAITSEGGDVSGSAEGPHTPSPSVGSSSSGLAPAEADDYVDEAYSEDSRVSLAGQQDEPLLRVKHRDGSCLPPVAIVIMVVGTRGDVQPFIGIALQLRLYGHRVRLASHAVYREFVESFGLEFYPLGGDPKVLSEFVVKHRGVNPGFDLKDVLAQRVQVRAIINSTYAAATEPDPEHPDVPFTAEAIVCNPPCYGHIHVAEKLRVPLHMVFTMPWTPTGAFPQPFARIVGTSSRQRKHSGFTQTMNWLSYFAMEDLTWMGLSDILKQFRCKLLGLKGWGDKYTSSHAVYYNRVPFTYIWSPALVPRPRDWRSHCQVAGFVQLNLAELTQYSPPPELAEFLAAGEPPIYIGFGSLVMDNPDELTKHIVAAVEATGVRAIIQKGWGGLGSGLGSHLPPQILLIDTCAHDWLFPRCMAVIHHGGAGKPTFIVPFFGDQPFWGWACHKAGVGPPPVPVDSLSTAKIKEAIEVLMLPASLFAAQSMQQRMQRENGAVAAVHHIHRSVYASGASDQRPRYMRLSQAGGLSSKADAADGFTSDLTESASQLLGRLRLPHHTRQYARRRRKMDQARQHRRGSSVAASASSSVPLSPDSTSGSTFSLPLTNGAGAGAAAGDGVGAPTLALSPSVAAALAGSSWRRRAWRPAAAVAPPHPAGPFLIKGGTLRRMLTPPSWFHTAPSPGLRRRAASLPAPIFPPSPDVTEPRLQSTARSMAAAATAAGSSLVSAIPSLTSPVFRKLHYGASTVGHSLTGVSYTSVRVLKRAVVASPIGWLGKLMPTTFGFGSGGVDTASCDRAVKSTDDADTESVTDGGSIGDSVADGEDCSSGKTEDISDDSCPDQAAPAGVLRATAAGVGPAAMSDYNNSSGCESLRGEVASHPLAEIDVELLHCICQCSRHSEGGGSEGAGAGSETAGTHVTTLVELGEVATSRQQ